MSDIHLLHLPGNQGWDTILPVKHKWTSGGPEGYLRLKKKVSEKEREVEEREEHAHLLPPSTVDDDNLGYEPEVAAGGGGQHNCRDNGQDP